MNISTFLPLVRSGGLIQWEPAKKPWTTLGPGQDINLEFWLRAYHEIAHAEVGKALGLEPTEIIVGYSGGGGSYCGLPLNCSAEHRLACAAGQAMSAIMLEEFGVIPGILDQEIIERYSSNDHRLYVEKCGGSAPDFQLDMAEAEKMIREDDLSVNSTINESAFCLYNLWQAACTNERTFVNPLVVDWTTVIEERSKTFTRSELLAMSNLERSQADTLLNSDG